MASSKWSRSFMFLILLILTLSLSVLVGSVNAQSASCPLGQGYWKTAPTWPVTDLSLGGQTYTQAELLALLDLPATGDASLIAAHQLIAAKLNLAAGGDPTLISGVIDQAAALLAAYPGKLPYNIAPASAEGQTLVNLGGVLDAYNSGQLTVNCNLTPTPSPTPEMTPEATQSPDDDDDDDGGSGGLPVTIVIEGPVQAINLNIITIYNINIQLAPDDPNLTIIQIGDIVHVEGNSQQMNGTIIIIAVTVIIINVDINVDTGEFWRDDGKCTNPPPSWAPANGWRRRCGGGNNPGGGSGGGRGGGRGNDDDDDDDDDD